jgi:uncharacterized membrane protein YvlD (DUF360 family)
MTMLPWTGLLISWLTLSVAVWVTAQLLPGFYLRGPFAALTVAALLVVLNLAVGIFVYRALLGGLGPAILVGRVFISAILLQIVDAFTDQLEIESFGWALGAAFTISLITTVVRSLVPLIS